MENFWFIPSHYLEAVNNYSKEKVITTNNITPTTGINETAKIPQRFLYFSVRDNINKMNFVKKKEVKKKEKWRAQALKIVSTIFLIVCFVCLK